MQLQMKKGALFRAASLFNHHQRIFGIPHNYPFGLAPYCKDTTANAPLYESKLPLSTGRPRLVCLGTGWGGARLLHDIDPKLYDITVISMRNHMVFTPLLSSTCVGTLEPQAVAVHITDIQPALFKPQNHVLISEAIAVCSKARQVEAVSDGIHFKVPYDKLVISTGSQGSTFGIPGVLEHTHFLRDLHQAEAIRSKLVDNISKAGIPGGIGKGDLASQNAACIIERSLNRAFDLDKNDVSIAFLLITSS
ncbi:pyridine nucleotide-disulfide oxidoreductase-domain-containing protein [Dunaliella salina]|uniref:Pyridine nucleotide-disulfide oxidoreductase-domain-containing protein n=1 Tax=Dunaliella salina TaxID=3046 RepID=A0ABQ7GA99_DUNSA|nr:pyridine nucleotide-disulfide oxidoreductase-domain-containing protein [Dunaliella salina]|eukprot:KAF5831525.1 pyridine nucleotide-disulfide oxidoreductase-domain-containing protein [Dunaliella salina]